MSSERSLRRVSMTKRVARVTPANHADSQATSRIKALMRSPTPSVKLPSQRDVVRMSGSYVS
jgi:hypothetical protein